MLDFQDVFDSFVTPTSNSNAIKDIYNMVPAFTQDQLQIIFRVKVLIKKYNLIELDDILNELMKMQKQNKNLSFMRSQNVKAMFRAYNLEELVQGVKPSVAHHVDSE